ncbi:MAG: polysaccharide biosynthesis tyrosine autokinase [Bacteroidaceae bacterium]
MIENNIYQNNNEENLDNEGIDIHELLFKYLAYWKWIVASVIVCLVIAFTYLRYATPIYSVSSTILLKDDKKGGGMDEMNALQDWGVITGKNNVDNEIELLRSKNLIKMVVSDLKLYTRYCGEGYVSDKELYKTSPVLVSVPENVLDSLSRSIFLHVEVSTTGKVKVEGVQNETEFTASFDSLPALLHTPAGILALYPNHIDRLEKDCKINISVVNPVNVARGYAARLGVNATSKTTSVIQLSITDNSVRRGIDFLNRLVDMYNRDAINDKNRVATNTDIFINNRLKKLSLELDSADRDLEKYKKSERITNIQADAQLSLQQKSQYSSKLVEVETQLNLVNYLDEYMRANADKVKLVPTNVGVSDATLQGLIVKYNTTLLELDRLKRTSSSQNPAVITMENTVDALYFNLLSSLKSVQQGLTITKKDLQKQADLFSSRINNVPTVEREYTERSRQQLIKSELFLSLLQKREENSLALAVTANSARVIDDANSSGNPISPKRKMVYMIALVLGFAIPIGIVYLLDILNIKIRNRRELESLTKIPVIGEIPLGLDNHEIAVEANVNNQMVEAFRLVRTNLQFMLANPNHKVVLVTSSIPGEGKSFVSINLAISLSLTKKRVLLMGMDIRKPTIGKYLGITKEEGVSSYLAGINLDYTSLIETSSISDTLDVLHGGTVPPNPSELLSNYRLEELFIELRNQYDYIVVDSAPIGLVSDTFVIGKYVDTALYVFRQDVSYKKNVEWLNHIVTSRKLTSLSLVLNGVKRKNNKYGYGYGYGYGNSYGQYGDDRSVKKKK